MWKQVGEQITIMMIIIVVRRSGVLFLWMQINNVTRVRRKILVKTDTTHSWASSQGVPGVSGHNSNVLFYSYYGQQKYVIGIHQ